MATYHGVRDGSPEELGETHVTVDGEPLPLRLDLYNHSPTGFEWAYNGSGPAQLALAILAHHFAQPGAVKLGSVRLGRGVTRIAESRIQKRGSLVASEVLSLTKKEAEALALRLHQDFKSQVVARFPRDGCWTLTTEQIRLALGPVTIDEALDDPEGFVDSMEESDG